ncbi:MAG: alcohol dehydrogenase catalytic domain-containing protein [Chloroflexi bacterium]|nr:alcohol dehydrogenase catalytic domain-containing protein [Chloroflexota bacterium]
MNGKSRAAVLETSGKVAVKELPLPDIGPEEGLLRVEMAGVCGSDPKFYHGKIRNLPTPMILGHETLGHIVEIGDVAAERYRVRKGDRVVVEANIHCGLCYYCLTGNYQFCERERGYGTKLSTRTPPGLWGSYSEYMYLAPNSEVHRVSDSVPAEAAILTTVIANGVQWARNLAGASIGNSVVVQGTGQQGLACLVGALESGCRPVIVTGLSVDTPRLALAKELGAHYTIDVQKEDVVARVSGMTRGRMADIVVDVTGSPQALQKSLDLVRPQGTILAGGLTGSETLTPMSIDKIVMKEIRFQGAKSKAAPAVLAALNLVESRKYPFEKLVTHRYPLDRAEEALKAAGGEMPGVYPVKVVIVP